MMTDEKKEYFKLILEQKWDGLQTRNIRSAEAINIQVERLPDEMERATSESARSFHLVLRERETERVHQIRGALRRLDDGTYGICRQCGEDISEGRLAVQPEAAFCIRCKQKQEAR
jgi:DnaK suppressor protein